MKPWLGSKAWLLALVVIFFIGNLMFWTYNSRETCDENGNCGSYEQHTSVDNKDEASSSPFHPDSPQQDQQSPPPPPPNIPQPPPPPPPPAVPVPPPPPAEAHLEPVLFQNNQPIKPPKTYMPGQHPASTQNLALVAPTADQITMRLKDGNALAYAERLEFWNIGLINTKPDVFIASEGHLVDIDRHYEREHRIYTLMKWILRVYRRDPTRTQPLLMVDAGSNHGLFSMVASASGAHTIAFEPQTNLRSVIGLGARLNQISPRLRVLPFAVLDKFRKVSMSNYNVNDGGIGFLDFANQNTIMQTQTIRLDALPAFDKLFTGTDKTLINSPQEIDAAYASGLEASTDNNGIAIGSLKNTSSLLRQPIHFLKIDVEGFELQALDSASELFAAGLVEHCVLEFGPPDRWDVTEQGLSSQEEVRKKTIAHAKQVLHRVTQEWDMNIYLLPAMGWDRTVQWMMDRDVAFNKNVPSKNKIVHYLKSWDFDGKPQEGDEFEKELEGKQNIITEAIPLLDEHIDGYMDDLESIGEMYLWFAKRSGNKAVMSKLEL